MKARKRIKTRRTNKRIWKKGAKQSKMNKPSTSMRGGRRL